MSRSPLVVSVAEWARSDRVGWYLVVAVAACTAVALSLGRPPAVDLPQHALLLRRFFDWSDPVYEVRWTTPYVAFYGLARGAWWFTGDPVVAVRVTFAVSVALLPVASAALAASLRKPPVLGCFALLGAFSFATAWGFASFVLGGAMVGFCLAAAVRHAVSASRTWEAILAGTLLLAYASHPVAWAVALPSAWLIVLTRSPRRLRPLWVATVATGVLFVVWQAGHEVSDQILVPFHSGPGALERVAGLPGSAAAFGRIGALAAPWGALGCLLLVCVVAGLAYLSRLVRRARRLRLRAGARICLRAWLRRCALPLCLLGTLACYFLAPLVAAKTFGIYPRFLLIGAVLTPIAVACARARSVRLLSTLAPIPALWLVGAVAAEVAHNAARTRCVDELASNVRPGEALVSLSWRARPAGYDYGPDIHSPAEPVARRGGQLSFEFVDVGAAPVRYAAGYRRELMPSSAGDARRFRPQHAAEFTAIWMLGGPALASNGAEAPELHACGDFKLLVDRSVNPGSNPPARFLPHLSPAIR
jgi:hypothetical protein